MNHTIKKILPYLIMLILVPIAGEFQFYPLSIDFRVSFATPTFLLLLLYFKNVHTPVAGVLVGMSVVLTRIGIGTIDGLAFAELASFHLPVIFYYITYGILFHFIPIQKYPHKPLYIGLFACLLEISSSVIELTARFFVHEAPMTLSLLFTIFLIAIVRSFFVMGFYMLILYHNLQTKEQSQRKKNDHILLVISDLYVEMFQLKKSIETTESATAESYYLSKELRAKGDIERSKQLLQISGKIHECKKDGQRIYASLANLITKQEFKEWLSVEEIIDLVLRSNKSYATYLQKAITFDIKITCEAVEYHSYFLLSILNNLIANAVESINEKGCIQITAQKTDKENTIIFLVSDDGPGIEEKYKDLVFSPGYTTKYDRKGNPSNGIGLSYIKSVIESHSGKIELITSVPNKKTLFLIEIPFMINIEEVVS